jgi:toxin ParE1/3/4
VSKVVLSELAESDLVEIWAFVAQDSTKAADHLIDQIHERCKFIATTPKVGRLRPEVAPSIRSFGAGSYLIFYREGTDGIEVSRVLHGRRDIPRAFGEKRRPRRNRS